VPHEGRVVEQVGSGQRVIGRLGRSETVDQGCA
jgi:hypothetical protein